MRLVIITLTQISIPTIISTRISATLNSNTNSVSTHITDKFLQSNIKTVDDTESNNDQIRSFVDSVKLYGKYQTGGTNSFIGNKMLASSSVNYYSPKSYETQDNQKSRISEGKKTNLKQSKGRTRQRSKILQEFDDELNQIVQIPDIIEIHKRGDDESPTDHLSHWVSAIQAIRHFKDRLIGYRPRCENSSRYFFRFGCSNPYSNL